MFQKLEIIKFTIGKIIMCIFFMLSVEMKIVVVQTKKKPLVNNVTKTLSRGLKCMDQLICSFLYELDSLSKDIWFWIV